jgi:PAS domain S-box-containing protein
LHSFALQRKLCAEGYCASTPHTNKMNRQKKNETTFRRSSALFDRAGRLVSWDAGFEAEFAPVEGMVLEGGTYFGIFSAILLHNFQARTLDGDVIDRESAFRALMAFGTPRSIQYRNPAGQIVNAVESLSTTGEVFRVAEDVTEEWTRKEELAEAKRRLNAAHPAPAVVPFTFKVSPEGRMELPTPTAAIKRLFGLSRGFDASDPMALYSRIEMTAQERAAMNDEARRCMATLEPFVIVYRVRDEDGNLRWIHNTLMPRRLSDGTTIFEGGLRDITSETLAKDQIELLRAVVVQSSDSVIVIENDASEASTILYINPAFERLYGRRLTEVAGRDTREYTQDPQELALHGLLLERLSQGNIDPIEFLVPRPDGTSVWVEARVCLLQGQLDGVHRWAVISRDISDRRRSEDELAHSERMLRDAQRMAKTGTWEADLRTGELRWSHGMYDLMGLDPERHAPDRQHFLSLVHPDDRESTTALSEHVFTGQGGIVTRTYRLLLKDGSERTMASHVDLIKDRDGNPERAVGTIQDVTEQRKAEQELMGALERARAADRAKSEFLAHMSHELRTPLNAIIGFSQLLMLKNPQFPLSPKQEEYLRDIHNSGEHLLDVINGILSLAKIEAGQTVLDEEDFEIPEIVDWAFRLLMEKASASGVALRKETDPRLPRIYGDPRLMRQALLNIISNATKFSHAGGSVVVRARRDETGGAVIAVSDTGIGMTAEEIAIALTPFGQAESSWQRRFEGTGLGLPLAKKFIELHGGALLIESTPSEGTAVTITLPRVRCLEDEPHRHQTSHG